MGLFKRKVNVNVMGNVSVYDGADGRYRKQAKRNRKIEQKKKRTAVLRARTPVELVKFIEEEYGTRPLPTADERYQRAYMGIKAHLVYTYAPELIPTKPVPKPNHPPVSSDDPDYINYSETEEKRWKESVMLPLDAFKMRLYVYNIPVYLYDTPIAWLEVYVETEYSYLSFKTVKLEYEEHYEIDKIKKDIINYFGASKADKKADNLRYRQYLSAK